jgi:hypothetical protein
MGTRYELQYAGVLSIAGRIEAGVKAAKRPRRRSRSAGGRWHDRLPKGQGSGVPQVRRQTGQPVRQRLRQPDGAAAPGPLARGGASEMI